jgi:hypothetical protein
MSIRITALLLAAAAVAGCGSDATGPAARPGAADRAVFAISADTTLPPPPEDTTVWLPDPPTWPPSPADTVVWLPDLPAPPEPYDPDYRSGTRP